MKKKKEKEYYILLSGTDIFVDRIRDILRKEEIITDDESFPPYMRVINKSSKYGKKIEEILIKNET